MSTSSLNSKVDWAGTWLARRAYAGQPLLALTAMLFLAMTLPTLLALAIDTRTINDISVWSKPLKFQVSAAVHLVTIAWLMPFLPQRVRARPIVVVLVAVILATSVFEVGYITWASAHGEASHFNLTTPFTRSMYSLMALAAIGLVGASAWLGGLILRYGDTGRAIVLAAGLGLVLGGVLGGVTGISLGAHQAHWVGGERTDLGGLPIVGWSRTGGDLRVAHFVGLHMMQVLPIAALASAAIFPAAVQRPLIWVFAAAGTLATAAVFVQALMGRPLIG